jgi:hypothetical protein
MRVGRRLYQNVLHYAFRYFSGSLVFFQYDENTLAGLYFYTICSILNKILKEDDSFIR